MQLLWLKSDYVIPPDTGGKIRTYNLLRQLRTLCQVTYASLKHDSTPNDEPQILDCAHRIKTVTRPEEPKQGLRFYGRVLTRMASPLPYIVQKYACREIHDYQQAWLAPSDEAREQAVVICDFLEMAHNVNWDTPYPKVLFQHNVESLIWRRYREHASHPLKRAYFEFERRRLERYEADMCNRFDLVLTVSSEDKRMLREEFGVTRPIEVIETGVDTEFFAPQPETRPQPHRLVFLGSLDWMPNIDGAEWFVQQVYPRIRQAIPETTLQLVGRRPVPEIQRLANGDPSIDLAPDVPDVRDHIAKADLFIVPLRIGGGSRIKIYEAMAMGRPVVSTRVGAEGLDLAPQQHISISEQHPEHFANQVIHLLKNPELKQQIAVQGYDHVVENYPWSQIAQKFHRLCQQLVLPSTVMTS